MRLVHRLANIHKLYYDINKVEVEGIQHTEKQVVKESIVGFYRHIYSKSEGWSACVENPPLLSLNKTNVVWLEREFTIKEILETLHDMDGDKALGLDGFTIMAGTQWRGMRLRYFKRVSTTVSAKNLLMLLFKI